MGQPTLRAEHGSRLVAGRQSRARGRFRSRIVSSRFVAELTLAVVLLPVIVGSASSAAAAPALGYTAAFIPTGVQASSVAADPATNKVYFADSSSQITVVDGATNAVAATIPLPAVPRGIGVDQLTDTVYVSLGATATSSPAVAVIAGATNKLTGAPIPLPVGSAPAGVAVNNSTDTIYVAERTGGVTVIDGSTNSMTTVSTGTTSQPYELAVDEKTNVVWIADLSGHVLALSGNSVTTEASFSGALVDSVAVEPDSNTIYATLRNGPLVVIDGATGTSSSIALPTSVPTNIFAVALDPGSGTVFASGFAGVRSLGTTWVIDASSSKVVDTIQRGGFSMAVDTANSSAYVAPYLAQPDGAWVLTPAAANSMSPIITSPSTTNFAAGSSNSFAVTVSALPPAATITESGPLPTGVMLNGSGVLSGTPAAGTGGVYPITITASNGVAPDYSQAFTLAVDEAASITAPSSSTFEVGSPVDVPLQVTGGFPQPTTVGASNLPAGLAVTAQGAGWALTGTPAAGSGGLYNIIVSATNGIATSTTTDHATVLEVPSITSAPSTTWLADGSDGFSLSVHGFPLPALTLTGSVPVGVAVFDPPSAALQEEPGLGIDAIGTHQFTINATNSAGTASQVFTLTVRSPIAVGVEGSDGQLWVQAPQLPSGWRPLGGQIVAPPAVAARPGNGSKPVAPLFIATGTNQHLYIRSLTNGWQELGPVTASCLGAPAAVITGNPQSGPFTLTVACRGLNNALWENSATLPASGLPQFNRGWTNLGGVLSAGPAVAPVGGTMTFFVRGSNGHIYIRTLTRGYSATSWACVGSPAAATVESGSVSYAVFQGIDHGLWQVTNNGSGWGPPVGLGGVLIGGPAVAANGDEPYLLGEGTNHAVWQRSPFSHWSSLGGVVIGGVGAANVT